MKNIIFITALSLAFSPVATSAYAASALNGKRVVENSVGLNNDRNISLDVNRPITLTGNVLRYGNKEITLGEKALFLNGALSDAEADENPYVFNSFQKAAAAFTDGTEEEPMTLYIAPYVYWIDNPDDPAIRVGSNGREPFGMVVKCNYLHLVGLNSDAENVVLASNRGQTQGAVGNFTMFDFWGDGLLVKNMTLGNFCNVDLEYKLDGRLSRTKRMAAITQAHVAYCHGDKVVADNVRFISRLNMNPLNGARRILFNNCHTESTDDALTGTGVFLNCSVDFYGTKPFWRSDMGGAVFLNSDIYVRHTNAEQYFCKSVGPLSVIDCRFHSNNPVYVGWTNTPTDWLRCYQYNVSLNGRRYVIGGHKPENTVQLDDKPALAAFRLADADSVVYNVYNLLCGDDGWDPLNQRETIERLEARDGRDYHSLASCLSVAPLESSMQTGGENLTLKSALKRHCNYTLNNKTVHWRTLADADRFVRLLNTSGEDCTVEAINHTDTTRCVSVLAYTDDGMECATEIVVAPDFVDAPKFVSKPKLSLSDGVAGLNYKLALDGRNDESVISWYRCADKKGSGKMLVAVSRLNTPKQTYNLTRADVGYYLMATIAPKHLRCLPGEEVSVVTRSAIKASDVKRDTDVKQASDAKPDAGKKLTFETISTDFFDFPANNQHELKPGFWTVEGYKPADTAEFDWEVEENQDYWAYGEGLNGTRGTGLIQIRKGGRLLYTPLDGDYGDMEVTWKVDPAKTAGQGFGSATGQYLDLYIKFDTRTLTGYALRIIRTTKHSHAVDFLLVRYDNGRVTEISPAVSAVCYRTDCTISLRCAGGKLTAHVETSTPLPEVDEVSLKSKVDLEADVTENTFGGFGLQHTGSCGESITMLHSVKAVSELR